MVAVLRQLLREVTVHAFVVLYSHNNTKYFLSANQRKSISTECESSLTAINSVIGVLNTRIVLQCQFRFSRENQRKKNEKKKKKDISLTSSTQLYFVSIIAVK